MSNNVLRFNTESAIYEREIPFDGRDENGKDVVIYTAKIIMTTTDMEKMMVYKMTNPPTDEDVMQILRFLFKDDLPKIMKIFKDMSITEAGQYARLSRLMKLVYNDLLEFQKKTTKSKQSMINRQQRRARK